MEANIISNVMFTPDIYLVNSVFTECLLTRTAINNGDIYIPRKYIPALEHLSS